MKNALLVIIGIIIGIIFCWFFLCKKGADDYTKNWQPDKYKHYECDSFFNTFKSQVANPKSKFAGLKIQKTNLDSLISSISSTGDVYLALVLDDSMNKILLVAGAPNPPSGDWDSEENSGSGQNSARPDASKDTIWYVMPDGATSGSNIGYIIKKEDKWISYNAADNSPSNLFVNKILKTVLPGREVNAGTVQGCPKNCPEVIAADLQPR